MAKDFNGKDIDFMKSVFGEDYVDPYADPQTQGIQSPDAYANQHMFNTPYTIAALRQMALSQMQGNPSAGLGGFQAREGWGDQNAAMAASMANNDISNTGAWRDLGASGLNNTNDFEMRRAALREMLRRQEYNRQTAQNERNRAKVGRIASGFGNIFGKVVTQGMGSGGGGGGNTSQEPKTNTVNAYGYRDNPWSMDWDKQKKTYG